MAKIPFYASGLRFSCKRCSVCCRHESGFVFLSEKDVKLLTAELKMDYNGFTETFCRWVPNEQGREFLSLKEKSNMDCVFWDLGCKVYNSRPAQCRIFPFWQSVVANSGAWAMAASSCPGMNSGELHDEKEVTACLKQQKEEPAVERKMIRWDTYAY